MALEKELEIFHRELPGLLAQEGRFALVAGDQVLGTYDTYRDAIQAGYAAVGLNPFLVKQIEAIETVHLFTRDLKTCPT
jgi:hypothetical protein